MPRRAKPRSVAPRLSIKRARGQGFPWPDDLAALLGQIPDEQLASKAGVCKDTVAAERRRRGIEPWQPHSRYEWTPEMIAQLGTESDRKLARALGTTRSVVRRERERRRIPPFQPPPHEPILHVHWEPSASDTEWSVAHQTIYHDRTRASILTLPVMRK